MVELALVAVACLLVSSLGIESLPTSMPQIQPGGQKTSSELTTNDGHGLLHFLCPSCVEASRLKVRAPLL